MYAHLVDIEDINFFYFMRMKATWLIGRYDCQKDSPGNLYSQKFTIKQPKKRPSYVHSLRRQHDWSYIIGRWVKLSWCCAYICPASLLMLCIYLLIDTVRCAAAASSLAAFTYSATVSRHSRSLFWLKSSQTNRRKNSTRTVAASVYQIHMFLLTIWHSCSESKTNTNILL